MESSDRAAPDQSWPVRLTPLQKVLGIVWPACAIFLLAAYQIVEGGLPTVPVFLFGALLALSVLALTYWPEAARHRQLRSAIVGWLRAFWWLVFIGAPLMLLIAAGALAAPDNMAKVVAGLSCLAFVGLGVAATPIVGDRALHEALPQAPQTLGSATLVLFAVAIVATL